MRPVTITIPQQCPSNLSKTFNETDGKRRNRNVDPPEPPAFIPERVAMMKLPMNMSRGDCAGFLFHFLTGTKLSHERGARGDPSILMDAHKRLQACMLYQGLKDSGIQQSLTHVQDADRELVPTITLDGRDWSHPHNATYDVRCSTDDDDAMAQLREQFFDDSTRQIRGLRLEFSANAVKPEHLRDIKVGVGREQHLSSIELKTDPANTAAESEVFSAVGVNSSIEQLSVCGNLVAGHRHGVTTALSNVSLENVEIKANEASCLHMLDWAAVAHGHAARNLRIDFTFWHPPGAKANALAKWNAAVVRLAESGTTKSLHLPWVIFQALTPETRQILKAAQMDVHYI
jgi:hypothetical protein